MAEFVLPTGTGNNVEYDFWLTSSSNRAINFIEDFEGFYQRIASNLTFTPHYVFWECINCDQSYLQSDCFGGGKYCAIDSNNKGKRGQEIILEDVR